MLTIEATATLTPDGHLTIAVPPDALPPDLSPGEHRVVLLIEEQAGQRKTRPPLNFPVDSYGSWPDDLSLRREDIYDDWGR
jgi:hypothetical protein